MTGPLWYLAQQQPVSVNPPQTVLIAVLMLGAAIVSGLSFGLRTLWTSYKEEKEAHLDDAVEFNRKTEEMLRLQIATTSDATRRIAESEKTVEAAMTIIHQVQARQLSGEALAEIAVYLRELRGRK